MKKVSMILGMATLALTASAALPQSAAVVNKNEVKAQVVAGAKNLIKKSGVQKAAPATINDVVGSYTYSEYRVVQSAQGWSNDWNQPIIELGAGSNALLVKNFWNPLGDADNVLCTLNATFDPATKSISIPGGQSVGTLSFSDGTSSPAYIYIQDWDSCVCSNKAIVFVWDDASNGYVWMADGMDSGNPSENIIVTSEANANGREVQSGFDFMVAATLDKFNATATTTLEGQTGVQEVPYSVNATYNGTTLTIANLLMEGFVNTLDFTVDKTNKTVYAPRTLFGENINFGQVSDDLYWEGDGASNSINGTFVEEGGLSILTLGTINLVTPNYGPALETISTVIPLPFDLMAGVGVKDITIDANAPVEYYNMQGMRVANPEKGQLVIARQGEKAVKMIVK